MPRVADRCRLLSLLGAAVVFGSLATVAFAEDKLFVAEPLTQPKEFTPGIEGPQCDGAGNVYAVNFKEDGTIGKVAPDGKGEVFITLPNKSVGNGIVFDRAGVMFIADYVNQIGRAHV